MNSAPPPPPSRRQRVVDSMAKKFADRGSVEQIIIRHRKRGLRSGKTLFIIIAATVISLVVTGLFTVGIVEPPQVLKSAPEPAVVVHNSLDILKADLAAAVINPDQFALYCKDYLNRYDSLPSKYQTPFSTTTSEEVYDAIADVWVTLQLRTRQRLLADLPTIETVQKERNRQQASGDHASGN